MKPEPKELQAGKLIGQIVTMRAMQGQGLLGSEAAEIIARQTRYKGRSAVFWGRTASELQATFDLQWKRMGKATKLWQKETGKHDIWPDLGDLLDWLIERGNR
jgi:hypothetical protein